MAKADNSGLLKYACFFLTLTVLFAGLVATWTVYGKDISLNAENISHINNEGTKQAAKNSFDVAILRKDVTGIQEDLDEMRTEQQAGFDEILRRLPK